MGKATWKGKKSKVGCWDLWHIMLCINRLLILAPTLINWIRGMPHPLWQEGVDSFCSCYSIITYTYGFLLPIKCNKYFVQKAWCHVLVLPSILVNMLEIQSNVMYLLLCGMNQQIVQRSCWLLIYMLLTKLEVKMADIGQVLSCTFMDQG